MKRTFKTVTAIALCAVMLSLTVLPVLAEEKGYNGIGGWATPTDYERFRAFFDQTDPGGKTNGSRLLKYTELCPDCVPEQYVPYNMVSVMSSPAFRQLLQTPHKKMGFYSTFEHGHNNFNYCESRPYDIYSIDYYGMADFSDTSLCKVSLKYAYHIDKVLLNDCEELIYIVIENSPASAELTALNTPLLEVVSIENCNFKHIAVDPKGADEPLIINVLGNDGVISSFLIPRVDERPDVDGVPYTVVTTSSDDACFYGWYSGGKLVRKARDFVGNVNEINDLVAVYTGDADGDGVVTTSDALCVMRSALGIDLEPIGAADTNGDNNTDMTDALTLMRFTMGLGFAG